jgi:tetratricopeptide (TPR) repeat protein
MWILVLTSTALAAELATTKAERLYKTGLDLVRRTHYLEALDMFNEARDLLDSSGMERTRMYGDLLFASAETKIKGRLHQGFPASYVKSALKDVRAANKLREKLPDILPQQRAAGYYLEGFIHKKFFMRKEKALSCFVKAVNIDPGSTAAKRELSELVAGTRGK